MDALQSVWHQERWFCFRREYLPSPTFVSTSIPQGDAISPLTLLALLTGLTGRVLQSCSVPHKLATFLDDRNLVAKTPEQVAELWQTWNQLSPRVGLSENLSKVQVVPRKKSFIPRLIRAGFETHHIAESARVLGVDFTARLGAACRPSRDARLEDAKCRIHPIGLLPVSVNFKAHLVKTLAVSKATWGAWLCPISSKPLLTSIRQVTGGQHIAGSPNLFFLLAGHGLHLGFAAGCHAFLHLASLVRQQPRPWPAASARGTWLGTVRSWLQTLKWREEGGWRWSHPNVDFVIDWSRAISDDIKSKEQHALRETWRRQQFQLFLDSGRRDATATHGSEYCESRCKIVRQTFQSSSTHMRACLIGAVVSDARFDKIIHPHADPSLCSWCDSGTVPTWHHLAWECAAFASTRCETPLDSLQRVLGWPSGQSVAFDGKVLAHLGSVREKILDRRWRGN